MATLRTVYSIWRMEKQTKNAKKIAEESGKLYDKFVGFLEDLRNIKDCLDKAQGSYTSAENKLKSGKGNLIGRAERIKKLGAKVTKNIPEHLKTESLTEGDDR